MELSKIEEAITQMVEKVNEIIGIDVEISLETCPHQIGISSQILVSVMGRLEDALEIAIPDNCYLFYDRKTRKNLSIREASKKLMNIVNI